MATTVNSVYLDTLAATADAVYVETDQGDNDHIRVGGLLKGIVEALRSINYTTETVNNFINNGGTTSDLINRLNDLKNDLNASIAREKANILEMIEAMKNGEGFTDGWFAGWLAKVKTYLISVGLLNDDGSKAWSYIEAEIDSLKAAVNLLKPTFDSNGNLIMEEYFQAWLHSFIENDTVITELKNRYAVTDSEEKLLKWLEAGLHQEVNANKAFTEVFAMAEDTEALQNAIARLKVQVDTINGKLTAALDLTSKIEDEVTGAYSMAGVITETTLGSALATLFAQNNDGVNNIIASITTKVKDQIAEIELSADVISNIASSYVISMQKLVIGGNSALFHTYNEADDPNTSGTSTQNLGFEMVVGDINVDTSTGNWTNNSGLYGRYRWTYFYFNADKIVAHRLMLDSPTSRAGVIGDRFSGIDLPFGSKIRWFYRIGANNTTGDQHGYFDHSEDAMAEDNPSGYITFNGQNVIIKGNLILTGKVTQEANLGSYEFTLNDWKARSENSGWQIQNT